MLQKTRGIVLHTVKYSETSLIAKVYTEEFGIRSYLVRGARSTKSKFKPALFQPLTLLEMVVYNTTRSGLQQVKEIRIESPYQTLPFDIRKSSIALFMNEVVYKALREEEPNKDLFEFLHSSCLLLDALQEPFHHFHLLFALRLTRYLGFSPRMDGDEACCFFNLAEGTFQPVFLQGVCLDRVQSAVWRRLLEWPLDRPAVTGLGPSERDAALDATMEYFRFHLPGFSGFRSAEVLKSVLS